MSITTAGDNLIHYEALGRGKPLVFVHGWLGSWRYWWPSMQALSSHYRTFALDLWGFGDSSKAREHYSLNDYVKLLEAFLERLAMLEPVVIVGHSLGAAVALRFAMQNPQAVSHIAAVSLPVSGDALNHRVLQGDQSNVVTRTIGRAADFPELEVEVRKTDPSALSALTEEIRGEDFSVELENLSCPVLMIMGEQDPLIQQAAAFMSLANEARPDRAFITFPSCMHFPMLEETAKFNRLILEFLHAGDDVSSLTPKEYWKRRTY